MDGLGNTNGKEAASTPEEYKEFGDVQYKLKDYRAAIELYTNGIEKTSQNPKCASILYNNRAAARMMILQYSLASEDCDRAISLDASNVKAYFRKASALKKSGAFEAAVEAYNKGLLIDPTNSMQLKEKSEADLCLKRMQHAKELIKNSLFPPALHALDAVLQVAPQSMNVKLLKVDALIGCQRYDEAYTLSGGILRHDPSNTKLMQDRAKCLYMMGNLDGALKHLAEAARHDPDGREHIALMRKARGMEATKERGNKAFSAGKMQAAIDAWKEALAIDPMNKLYNAKLHFNCANAFARLKKHKDAVQAATLAIDCDRKYAKAYLRRASSLFALGNVEDLENCIRDYEKVSSMLDEGGKNDVQKELHKAQIALKQAKRKDYYKILGVPRDADEDTIKKAYRKAALKWHPDRQNGREEAEREEAERVFREINDAYSVLSDLPKKKLYDSGVDSEDLDNPHAGHGFGGAGMHSVDPNVLFQMFCQQQRGGGNSDRGFKFG